MNRLIRKQANTPGFTQITHDANLNDVNNANLGLVNDDWKLSSGIPGEKEMGTAGTLAFDRDLANNDGTYRFYLVEVLQFQHTKHTETASAVLVYEYSEQGTATSPPAYAFKLGNTAHDIIPTGNKELQIPNGPVLIGLKATNYAAAVTETDQWVAAHAPTAKAASLQYRLTRTADTVNVYRYDELSDKAKLKAQEFLYEVIFGGDEWCKYDLAEGLEDIHNAGFDVDDDNVFFDVDYSQSAYITIPLPTQALTDELVRSATGKTLTDFAKVVCDGNDAVVDKVKNALTDINVSGALERNGSRRQSIDMDDYDACGAIQELVDAGELDPMTCDRFSGVVNVIYTSISKKADELAENLFQRLRQQSDYLTEDEYLTDFADANDYRFTVDGYYAR